MHIVVAFAEGCNLKQYFEMAEYLLQYQIMCLDFEIETFPLIKTKHYSHILSPFGSGKSGPSECTLLEDEVLITVPK
jgi:hypothetical protein